MSIVEGDYKLADEGRGKCMVKVKADGEDKWRLSVKVSAANRLIGEVVQSRRRPLLGPSPC